MHRTPRGWFCVAAWLIALSSGISAQDTPAGTVVPGTSTPIAAGDPVLSSPQRGHVVFAPRKKRGPTPWNALAHALGYGDRWIQPGDGARSGPGGDVVQVATMQQILGDSGCTVMACDATSCEAPGQLVWLLYGLPKGAAPPPADQLPDDDYWLHAMRRTATGWTSKDGTRERRDDISDPVAVLNAYMLGDGERTVIRCACCAPAGAVTSTTTLDTPTTSMPPGGTPSTTLSPTTPTSQPTSTTISPTSSTSTTTLPPALSAVRLTRTLHPSLPAGVDVCLERILGGYIVAAHGTGCASPHLHSVPDVGIMLRVGDVMLGPFEDPDPSGCGYGPIVACPSR